MRLDNPEHGDAADAVRRGELGLPRQWNPARSNSAIEFLGLTNLFDTKLKYAALL
jgi:hypothetical protein